MAEKVPLKKGTTGIQERFHNYCMFLDVFDHLAAAMFVCDTGWQKMVAENLVSHKLCFSLWQQPGKKKKQHSTGLIPGLSPQKKQQQG